MENIAKHKISRLFLQDCQNREEILPIHENDVKRNRKKTIDELNDVN